MPRCWKQEYEFHAASPQLGSADADATFCHGTGLFVRRAGPLWREGRFIQPPWDHDGHVAYWESPRGRIVGCYLPTPTMKQRLGGPSQATIRAQIDVHLRSLLEELVATGPPLLAVMGDLNVTLARVTYGQSIDSTREFTGPAYTAAKDGLRGTMEAVGLIDAWRDRHPGEQRYSSFQRQPNNKTQARVDLALVPMELMDALVHVELMDTDGDWTYKDVEGNTCAQRSDHACRSLCGCAWPSSRPCADVLDDGVRLSAAGLPTVTAVSQASRWCGLQFIYYTYEI